MTVWGEGKRRHCIFFYITIVIATIGTLIEFCTHKKQPILQKIIKFYDSTIILSQVSINNLNEISMKYMDLLYNKMYIKSY
jgi:hypothetical protein